MTHIRILPLALLLALVSGCSTQQADTPPADTLASPESSETVKDRPPALQVLKDAGLMTNDDYKSADYIPNSNYTMIIADVRDAPCKMIFLYITTSNGDYWMPNQIGCSP
ncbi:hypothetical protein KKJ25_19825 [Xenorhabdus bovienii]|uniref:hypothetical protein n=1 Tax=Xenorhabdus bovienii TaxID=40576 RepID=UPI00237D0F0F|nr:hypothetical protein [Xenorhabdus bovienii]MDE1497116.1 hypothetical protein [Xenorhabdus bovienii]